MAGTGGRKASARGSRRGIIAAITVVVVCVVAGLVTFSLRGTGSELTAETTGRVVAGDQTRLDASRYRCDATIEYTVDGQTYRIDDVLDARCASADATVHYDPSAPAAGDTDGPSVAPLVLTGLFALLAVGALASLVVQLRARRRRDPPAPRPSIYGPPAA